MGSIWPYNLNLKLIYALLQTAPLAPTKRHKHKRHKHRQTSDRHHNIHYDKNNMSPSQKPKFPPNYAHSHGNPKPDITVDVVHITTSDTNSESEYDRKVKLFFQNK